jgi:hypothetical protein
MSAPWRGGSRACGTPGSGFAATDVNVDTHATTAAAGIAAPERSGDVIVDTVIVDID